MCLVAAFELIYCVWGRPLSRNIFVSFSTKVFFFFYVMLDTYDSIVDLILIFVGGIDKD